LQPQDVVIAPPHLVRQGHLPVYAFHAGQMAFVMLQAQEDEIPQTGWAVPTLNRQWLQRQKRMCDVIVQQAPVKKNTKWFCFFFHMCQQIYRECTVQFPWLLPQTQRPRWLQQRFVSSDANASNMETILAHLLVCPAASFAHPTGQVLWCHHESSEEMQTRTVYPETMTAQQVEACVRRGLVWLRRMKQPRTKRPRADVDASDAPSIPKLKTPRL
jgi:hypothetical protein